MKKIILIKLLCFALVGYSQNVSNCNELEPSEEYENIHVKKIDTDANKTSFIIWVKNYVKPHMHEHHTETLYVISGSGEMAVKGEVFTIKAGDYINIPQASVHSVKVTSEDPLKVISVQAPEFLGKDRIFVE